MLNQVLMMTVIMIWGLAYIGGSTITLYQSDHRRGIESVLTLDLGHQRIPKSRSHDASEEDPATSSRKTCEGSAKASNKKDQPSTRE